MKLSSLINELTIALEKNGDQKVVIVSPVIGTVVFDQIKYVVTSPITYKHEKYPALIITAQ